MARTPNSRAHTPRNASIHHDRKSSSSIALPLLYVVQSWAAPPGSRTSARQRWRLGYDCDTVLDRDDARCRPGDPLRLLSLGPRAHGPFQDDLIVLHLDRDPFGVRLGTPHQGILDLPLKLLGRRLDPRADRKEIGHPTDTGQAAHCPLSILLLVLPLDLATQGDPSFRDGHVQLL